MFRFSAFACFVLMMGAAAAGPAHACAQDWMAGVAKTEITPDGPVWMAGYASRKEPSQGVDHPLFAKALAISDGSVTTLWITVDLIGIDSAFTDKVKNRIREANRVPMDATAIFASHTHTGPLFQRDYLPGFQERGIDPSSDAAKRTIAFRGRLEETLVKLAARAVDSLEPATLAYGVDRAGFAMNRREKTEKGVKIGVNPSGPTDKDTPAIVIKNAEGKVTAVVFGYACHNTTLTDKGMKISGDYAGFAADAIERAHPGSVALYITGCAGDINPEPRGKPEMAPQHGAELAAAVARAIAGKTLAIEGSLRYAYAEVPLKFAGPTDKASYEKRLSEPGSSRQAHARRILAMLERGESIATEVNEPIQVFAVGDKLTMIAFGGEVVSSYSLRLKRELASADRPLWVSAYANDVLGYVADAKIIREGGYEGLDSFYYGGRPAPFSEEIEEVLIKKATELFTGVRKVK